MCGAGAKAHADILRLVATLLILQLLRMEELEEGQLLDTLFSLNDCSGARSVSHHAKQHGLMASCVCVCHTALSTVHDENIDEIIFKK